MDANWQPSKMDVLPKPVAESIDGSVAWNGKVGIDLPYHSGARYKVDITGDLKNVSSHLPAPLNKRAGEALPMKINVDGDLNSFALSGNADAKNHFNSRWLWVVS